MGVDDATGERIVVPNAPMLRARRGAEAPPVPEEPRPAASHARAWIAGVGLLCCLLVILMVTLSPTPVDRGYESVIDRLLEVLHSHGVPIWFGYRKLEFTANVAMFLPLGFLLALALPRRVIWAAFLLIPAFSALLELTQAVLLSARFGTLFDVLANTVGGYLGALVAILVRLAVNARDERIVALALWRARYER